MRLPCDSLAWLCHVQVFLSLSGLRESVAEGCLRSRSNSVRMLSRP